MAVQEETEVRISGKKMRFRFGFKDSRLPYVEAMFETPPNKIRVVREARLTYPEVFPPPHPDLPRPLMFDCAVDDVVRFKSPDASMIALQLTKPPKGER